VAYSFPKSMPLDVEDQLAFELEEKQTEATSVGEQLVFDIVTPPKRESVLYARIKEENLDFLKACAIRNNISLSVLMDQIIDQLKGKLY
jgi:hypothetical protein